MRKVEQIKSYGYIAHLNYMKKKLFGNIYGKEAIFIL
jgi:hypothetical protein